MKAFFSRPNTWARIYRGPQGRFFLALIISVFFCLHSWHAFASQLIFVRILNIDPIKKVMTVEDIYNKTNRTIFFKTDKDIANLEVGEKIRMWVSESSGGAYLAEKIYTKGPCDMTGIKRRLKKATRAKGHKWFKGAGGMHRGLGFRH